jgi:hypothetical protein
MSVLWSIIANRKDGLSKVWKEWRSKLVDVSTGASDAGAIPMLGPDGKIDPSMISGGSGGSGNFLQVEVDFGFLVSNEGDIARTTVMGQSWVTSGSVILCNPAALATPDHGADDAIVEGLVAYAENLVPGTGFDVVSYAPDNTWGRYFINVTGQ